jgi:osmotically-inducible protein OsmY
VPIGLARLHVLQPRRHAVVESAIKNHTGEPDMKRIGISALLAALVLTTAACAGGRTQESTGQYFDDAAITTKVKTAIFNDPNLKANEIAVETYKGVVQLSGFVASQSEATRAVEVARSVAGVKSVKNDIHLK